MLKDPPLVPVPVVVDRPTVSTWRHRWVPRLHVVLLAVLAPIAAVTVLPLAKASGPVGPGEVSLRLGWDPGGTTELAVPPLGSLAAHTHSTPLRLTAEVESIDVVAVQTLVTTLGSFDDVRRDAEHDLSQLVRDLALRSSIVALVAGALVGAVMPGRRWKSLAVGAGAAVTVTGGLLAVTYLSFDTKAFLEPQFEGALSNAPNLLAAVQREFSTLEGLRDRVSSVSDRLNELYAAAAAPAVIGRDGTVRILHVSDIHLNPMGVTLAGQLAERFQVTAIVDTGDLTSFGYPFEAEIGQMIENLAVPYYLVPGNHDSLPNRLALDRLDNLTVVDGSSVDIGGVKILGFADPSFTADGHVTYEENRDRRRQQAPAIASAVRRQRPDVLAVAGMEQAEGAVGLVPLVISGDLHERRERDENGTVMLNVGSTGATGVGSFTVDADLPYEAEVLNFRDGKLVALDYVKVVGLTGGFTVQRVVYPT